VRHLLLAVKRAHLVERADSGAQAPVDGEDAPVDERAEREVVEGVGGGAPDGGGAVLADALVVEAVDLVGCVWEGGGGWKFVGGLGCIYSGFEGPFKALFLRAVWVVIYALSGAPFRGPIQVADPAPTPTAHLRDLARLVVAAHERDAVGVADLER
jgi:hypothetical protein